MISIRKHIRWVVLGALMGALGGIVYNDVSPPHIHELPEAPIAGATFVAQRRLQRIVIGAVVGCCVGVSVDTVLAARRSRRQRTRA